jgi:hypothetical protein
MLSMPVTHHAVARMQQRAVRPEIVDYLLDFGRCEHHQRGAQLYYLDRRGRECVRRVAGSDAYRRMEHALDAYVVVSGDGELITVGHRYKRISHY